MPKKPIPITPESIAAHCSIDLEAILRFHRDPDAYVGFARKADPAGPPKFDKHGKPKVWENLCSIKVSELETMFPEFANFILKDSYFTLNSYYRPAPYRNAITGLPDVWRKESNLSWLTAAPVDVDCGRQGSSEPGASIPSTQGEFELRMLVQAGEIPMPSLFAHSGRGVYVFWLLRDELIPNSKGAKAFPEKVALYKKINRALVERIRTAKLPADISAIDAARVLRIPGSYHSVTGKRVVYMFPADERAKSFVYTLTELARFLSIDVPGAALPDRVRELAAPAQYRRSKKPGSAPLRSHGPRKLAALRAQDLLTLEAWRGGFLKRGMKHDDGHISPGRRFILRLYGMFLRAAKLSRKDALPAMLEMAANMHPPFPSDPDDVSVKDVVAEVYTARPCRWGNEKLCAVLGVNEAVALDLELKTIMPLSLMLKENDSRATLEQIIQGRREFARSALAAAGHISCRKLAELYRRAGFGAVSHEIANRDLNAIGYRVKHPRPPEGGENKPPTGGK